MFEPSPLLLRARALTGFVELVNELGGDPASLLAAAGIEPQVLSHPEATISLPGTVALLERAADRLVTPHFGLLLAQRQDISVLGPMALIARGADTVGSALAAMARNLPYHVARTSLYLQAGPADGDAWLRYELPREAGPLQRQAVEMCCLLTFKALRMLTGNSGTDARVAFAHSAGPAPSHHGEIFTCPVDFQQEGNGVIFPESVLRRPLEGGRQPMHEAAERFVAQVIRRNPLDLACQIEELIARQLASGCCSLADIARQLNVHERTLQRRLDAQQIRFVDILDRVRQGQAREFLRQRGLPLTEVANLLGYSEQRSLSRACRRWFGTTPAALRAEA